MIEAVIFDFDGVIVDSEPLHCQAFRRTMQPFDIDFDYQFYCRQMLGFDDRDALRYLAEHFGQPELLDRLGDLIHRKSTMFEKVIADGIQPYPGIIELVRSLARHYPLAICSGALQSDIDLILPQLDDGTLGDCFKIMVTADDVERSKPHPESYRRAAELLRKPPENCLAIEDTPHGIQSAADTGMTVVALEHTYPRQKLAGAHLIVPTPADIPTDDLTAWVQAQLDQTRTDL